MKITIQEIIEASDRENFKCTSEPEDGFIAGALWAIERMKEEALKQPK